MVEDRRWASPVENEVSIYRDREKGGASGRGGKKEIYLVKCISVIRGQGNEKCFAVCQFWVVDSVACRDQRNSYLQTLRFGPNWVRERCGSQALRVRKNYHNATQN